MDNNIQQMLRRGDNLKKIMLITLLITLFTFILGGFFNIPFLLWIAFAGVIVAVPTTIVYIEHFMPMSKSIKYLSKHGLQDVISDVKSTEFNLPISKIYMGNRAFYAKKPSSIIPYRMVVWVYIQQTKYMGVVPMDETINVFCRDGETFAIKANRNELLVLLQQIQQHSPDLIVGYGREQENQYYIVKKNFKNG